MRRINARQITVVDYRFAAKKSKIVSRISTVPVRLFAVLLLGTLLGGCSVVSSWTRARQLSYQAKLSAPYDQIKVKESVIHDAVPKIQRLEEEFGPRFAEAELISHSENVVASLGQSKDGFKTWLNMVTFQKHELNVVRKYFFIVDDKARILWPVSGRGLRFDCEMVLEKEVLAKAYTTESARRIAILRYVADSLRKDMDELSDDINAPGQENKMVDICRMLINQAFEAILLKLDSSPILATRLSQPGGVEFDHINFDKGKIRMVIKGDIVAVKICLGAFVHMIENHQSKRVGL